MEYPHTILVHQPEGIECVHLAGPDSITHVFLPDAQLEAIRQERAYYRAVDLEREGKQGQ